MQTMVQFGHKLLNRLSLNGMEAIKMVDITEIMDMLDWHMPPEIQSKGTSLVMMKKLSYQNAILMH